METFTADDFEGGYTTVTPKLFVGMPPFKVWPVSTAAEGAEVIRNRDAVMVYTSDEAAAILRELDVDEARIEQLLHAARYGLLATYPPGLE